MLRRRVRWTLPLGLLLLAQAPSPVAAQRLLPIDSTQQCRGERIASISYRVIRRPLLSERLGTVARLVDGALGILQPPTRARVLGRYLLVREGGVCVEQARQESERLLRAQPFISDAAIRAIPVAPGLVRLSVESVDEYVIYLEGWGVRGVPAGLEIGSGNVAGSAVSMRGLVEIGRGQEFGWGLRYTDHQFLGRPIILDARVRSRPLSDVRSVSLAKPWFTNRQRDNWQLVLSDSKGLYTFRDPVVRDISIDYRRQVAAARWERRLGDLGAPLTIGAFGDFEVADGVRTLLIRDRPIVVPTPAPLQRYGRYEAARIGVTMGVRRIRFRPIRGLGALSATEDVPIGLDAVGGVQVAVPTLLPVPSDRMTMLAVSGGVGGASSLLRWSFKGEWVSARRDLFPAQTNLEGRLGWSGKLTERHLTQLVVHGASARHVRFPLQHTLRDDIDGLLGYRTANLGGGSRVVAAFEERHRLPIPTNRLEVAVSALAQTGRLWAGDTPYGTTTPWYQAVGGAVMISYPAGARQALRIEYGRPLNAPAGLQRHELRVVYADVTGRF